tara:strand:+ start:2335 stop:2796 length:462 start_codon:yes stop_codon:yes gene_type:complete
MRNEEFIQSRLIDESQKLLAAKFYFPAFLIASQGIETLGAFLDKKPLSAKRQSKKRFYLAIRELFKENYQTLSQDDWLYKQLRCNMSHLSHHGGFVNLFVKKDAKHIHLAFKQGCRTFVIDEFLSDFESACNKLNQLLIQGILPQKKMSLRQI